MRPIDADVLKKDLTRFYDNEVTAKRLIDEQPTIEPEPHWIPCTERLPETSSMVLSTADYGDGELFVGVDKYIIDGCWLSEGPEECKVIAWMPLPEPYKKEGDAG